MLTDQGIVAEVARLVEENRVLRASQNIDAAMRIKLLEIENAELRRTHSCKNCWGACDICLKAARRCQSDHK